MNDQKDDLPVNYWIALVGCVVAFGGVLTFALSYQPAILLMSLGLTFIGLAGACYGLRLHRVVFPIKQAK